MPKKCKCKTLEKFLATNFPYFRCPDCGRKYFGAGDAKVIDKCHLGSLIKREKELDKKARELGLTLPSHYEKRIREILKICQDGYLEMRDKLYEKVCD